MVIILKWLHSAAETGSVTDLAQPMLRMHIMLMVLLVCCSMGNNSIKHEQMITVYAFSDSWRLLSSGRTNSRSSLAPEHMSSEGVWLEFLE